MGEGTVTAVMADRRMLTIAHAPIEALGWPEMTMDFTLTERVELEQVKVGSRIHFSMVQGKEGAYHVDSIEVME